MCLLSQPIDEVPEELREQFRRVVEVAMHINYKEMYALHLRVDATGNRLYLQVRAWRKNTVSGEMGLGPGGKFYLSPHMTDQEIVQNGFGLFKAYEEHECREFFTYKGKRIYGPHISLDALLEIADRTTYRS